MRGSQTGISTAMLRFSQRLVPIGQVPSTGKALTGSRSPLPASITAVTRCTKSGASSATIGGRRRVDGDAARHRDLVEVGEGLVHGGEVPPHDLGALLAVGLLEALLDLRDGLVAGQHAGDGEEAGLHDRVDAAAHAGLPGHRVGVDGVDA